MWCDGEQFLRTDTEYSKHKMIAVRFPPASGDLNPIETVWARLRKELASREFEDLRMDKVITTTQFEQRAAQILTSYGVAGPGEQYSYLEKLLRGMPKRLVDCKKNKYHDCGK